MSRVRVPVKTELISWALDQANRDVSDLPEKGSKVSRGRVQQWLDGTAQPTVKQL